ncbi:osteopontin [Siphateles boraxobius]|uniref:osteopontin n=1 Tax=Siphateles boraxobius TaxID=180520 RepID=UPI0040635859
MKTVIVLTLLIATVFCLPVKRSASSSESSEEMLAVQRPPPILQKADANMFQEEPTQTTPADSNESTNSEDDTEEADEESDTDEDEENETDSSESNSGETQSTVVPSTVEPSLDPIINTGRGDSMGYPSDYKKNIVYVDANNFEKLPSPYKSYSSDKLGGLTFVSKKTSAYDDQSFNDVEKEIQLHKALQVHDLLEEDTSTPEMENMEPGDRQATLGGQEIVPAGNQESDGEGASAGDSTDSTSASASQEENTEESDSSEETTATPGAADSDSDSSQSTESQESDSDEKNTQTTEASIINAK